MQTLYTSVKVNNEIELCAVSEPECKKLIEKALLENRISYAGPRLLSLAVKRTSASSVSMITPRKLRKKLFVPSAMSPATV